MKASPENPLSEGERRLQPSGVGPARPEQPTPTPLQQRGIIALSNWHHLLVFLLAGGRRIFGCGSGSLKVCSGLITQSGIESISVRSLDSGDATRSIREEWSSTVVLGSARMRSTSKSGLGPGPL